MKRTVLIVLIFIALTLSLTVVRYTAEEVSATTYHVSVAGGLEEAWSVETPDLVELDTEGADRESAASDNRIVSASDAAFPREERECTIMVYMIGSDLEANNGCASLDLYEMINGGLDSSRYNLVIYTGGSQRWHASIPNDHNCVIEVADGQAQIVAGTQSSQNMGDPGTLSSFVIWANQNYPAQHTVLLFWDHGMGPQGGYGCDQLFRLDSLTLAEMTQAMDDAGYGGDNKLEWVGFDACLMGSLEVMQTWRPYARYFVGSQDLESGYGWDYSFLESFGDPADARGQVEAVVGAFGDFYESGDMGDTRPNATLAAIDLAQIEGVEQSLEELTEVVSGDFENGDFVSFARAREACCRFGSASDPSLIDLVDFAERLAREHPEHVDKLVSATDKAIVANSSNVEGAHGISMYFPQTAGSTGSSAVTAPTEGVQKVLASYADRKTAAQGVDWSGFNLVQDGDAFKLDVSADQADNIISASYTVLVNYRGRGWLPVLRNVSIDLNGDSAFSAPVDPLVVCSPGGGAYLPLRQSDAGSSQVTYRCESASLMPGTGYIDMGYGDEGIDIVLAIDDSTGAVDIVSVTREQDEDAVSGRDEVVVSDYKDIMCPIQTPLILKRNESGAVLPYNEWTYDTGYYVWSQVALVDGLNFETHHVSELGGSFAIQVCVRDISGEVHATELVELASADDSAVAVETDKGQMTFVVKGDHAELSSYTGDDEELAIPGEVKGVPVTAIAEGALANNWSITALTLPSSVKTIGADAIGCHELVSVDLPAGLEYIGNDAFAGCYDLEHIDLPEGLAYIGRGAFRGLGAQSVRLPSSLTYLGEGAFTGCRSLTSFEVAEGCSAAKAEDGVLYSADGTVLIAFPVGREGSFDVPKGTQTIGYAAFAYNKLSAVSLPEGLTRIDNLAFYGESMIQDSQLSEVVLPNSLEYIGAYAFGTAPYSSAFQKSPHIEVLRLGAKVSFIGAEAFSGLRLGRFEVNPANLTYTSPGGFLANAAGDTILEVPSDIQGPIVVPDGITSLGADLFEHYSDGVDIIVPASVSRVSVHAFPYHWESGSKDQVYDVRLHGQADSAIAKFAANHGIPFDEVVDPNLLTCERVAVEEDGVQFEFDVFSDRATLVGVNGLEAPDVRTLAIPDEVEGVPVTQIADLGESTSRFVAWESVVLPRALESIDTKSLRFLCAYDGFVLSDENENYQVVDGVLFSANGSELIAFALADPAPNDEGEVFSYEIPAGTQTIGAGAFKSSRLEKVSFASSVRTVRSEAFAFNYELRDIELNEGLARVEDYAFSCPATSITLPSTLAYIGDNAFDLEGFENLELPGKLSHLGSLCFYDSGTELFSTNSDVLRIGPRLSEIGYYSLSSLDVEAFEVDERNTAFASVDGLLTSKDGTELIMCPSGLEGELRIPDGIERLDSNCLEKASGVTDVYFPGSVVSVDGYARFGASSPAGKVTFHCKHGSAAQLYAAAHGIDWVEE